MGYLQDYQKALDAERKAVTEAQSRAKLAQLDATAEQLELNTLVQEWRSRDGVKFERLRATLTNALVTTEAAAVFHFVRHTEAAREATVAQIAEAVRLPVSSVLAALGELKYERAMYRQNDLRTGKPYWFQMF